MTQRNKEYKVILNVHMANRLLEAGFPIVEVKPSTRFRGRAVFIFERSPEFDRVMYELSEESRAYRENN